MDLYGGFTVSVIFLSKKESNTAEYANTPSISISLTRVYLNNLFWPYKTGAFWHLNCILGLEIQPSL